MSAERAIYVCARACLRARALPVSGIAQAQTAGQDAQDEAHLLHWDQPVLTTHQIPLDSTHTHTGDRSVRDDLLRLAQQHTC